MPSPRSSARRTAPYHYVFSVAVSPTRLLYICDNLPVLRGLNTDSVDLVATDPPFNARRVFNAPLGSKAAGQRFDDRWRWDQVTDEWFDLIVDEHRGVKEVIEAAAVIEGGDVTRTGEIRTGRIKNSMAAFLCWMAPRLIELARVLKLTGSLYVHCDQTANAYLKLLLDAIFTRKNFRNEIIWCYTGPSAAKNHFPRKHDTILFYAGPDARFDSEAVRLPYKAKFTSARGVHGTPSGIGAQARHAQGRLPTDWWADDHLSNVSAWRNELTGWSTQKPLALYERIIKVSSAPGDLVLDPFCGCSTTLVAAERLGRHWIGCDIDPQAEPVVTAQMDKLLDPQQRALFRVVGEMKTRKAAPRRSDIPRIADANLRELVWRQQHQRCWNPYCDSRPRSVDLHLDHKIPKVRGGSDASENRIGLCGNCNMRKGRKAWGAFLNRERISQPHPPSPPTR